MTVLKRIQYGLGMAVILGGFVATILAIFTGAIFAFAWVADSTGSALLGFLAGCTVAAVGFGFLIGILNAKQIDAQ